MASVIFTSCIPLVKSAGRSDGDLAHDGGSRRLDTHGTEFEFRYLAIRIEGLVGQQIGRRLVIAEWQEDLSCPSGRCRPGHARPRLPRRERSRIGRRPRRPSPLSRSWCSVGDRRWFDRIEHAGAARHGAGMPVFELAPGDQDQREFVVRQFIGVTEVRRAPGVPCRRRAGNCSVKITSSPGSPSCSQG